MDESVGVGKLGVIAWPSYWARRIVKRTSELSLNWLSQDVVFRSSVISSSRRERCQVRG